MAKKQEPKKTIEQKLAAIDNNARLNKKMDKGYAKVASKQERAVGNPAKLSKIESKFGYDYKAAIKSNRTPDSSGHWPSVADNGQILKGKRHPSMPKTIKTEKVLGNKIFNVGGKQYTAPKKEVKSYKKFLKKSIGK